MPLLRKVIKVSATDSPNVLMALAQMARGEQPTNEILLPGVLTWEEYQERLKLWESDPERLSVGLLGEFYEGPETKLFPDGWLELAHKRHDLILSVSLNGRGSRRQCKGIGCDPAEGGDSSCWTGVDETGILFQESRKTPDTNVIPSHSALLIREHGIDPQRFVFDRGGGGKQHADRMRAPVREGGYDLRVRSVAFGEAPHLEPKRGLHLLADRKELIEDRYVYVNLRAQMYHEAALLLDPTFPLGERYSEGFAIPRSLTKLVEQLRAMPRLIDGEGRYWLPPKNKKDPKDSRKTLVEIIGHSPDEADSFVLAVHAMLRKSSVPTAGAVV
jgi:hypothetical protein